MRDESQKLQGPTQGVDCYGVQQACRLADCVLRGVVGVLVLAQAAWCSGAAADLKGWGRDNTGTSR